MINRKWPGMGKGRVHLWGGSENTAVRFALVGLTCAASATLTIFAFQPGNKRLWRLRVMSLLLPWQRSFQQQLGLDHSGIILSSAIERSARDRTLRSIGIFFLNLQDLPPGTTVDEIHAIYQPLGLSRSWSGATPAFGSQGLLLCLVVTREKEARQENEDSGNKGPTRFLLVELSSDPRQREVELRMFEMLEGFSTPRRSSQATKTSEPTLPAQNYDESTYLATMARLVGGYHGLVRVENEKGEALRASRRKSRGGAREESGASDSRPFDGHRGDGMDDAGRWFAALGDNRAGMHCPCTLTVKFGADAVLRPNFRQGQTEIQRYPDHSTAGFRFGGISWEGTAWDETLGGASSGIGGRIRMSHGEEWGRSLHPDAFGAVLVRFFHDGTQLRTGTIISTLSQLRVLIRCFGTCPSDEHATDERERDSKDEQIGQCTSPGVGNCNSSGFHPATILLAYDSFGASEGVEGCRSEVMENTGDVALYGSRDVPFYARPCAPQRGQGVIVHDADRGGAVVVKTTVRVVGLEACAGSSEEIGGARSVPGDSDSSAGWSRLQRCSKCKAVLHGLHRVVQLLEEILELSSVLPAYSSPERFSAELALKPFATSCTKTAEDLPAKDSPAPSRLDPSTQDIGLPSEESKEGSASDPSRKAMPASTGSDDVHGHAVKDAPEISAPKAARGLPQDGEWTPPSSVASDPEPDPHVEPALDGTRHDQMSAQGGCEGSEVEDVKEERDAAQAGVGDEPYPDGHGLVDEEERLIVEITEMTRRLPSLVHEDQTDVRAEVGRTVMAKADATAKIGSDGVSKTSALYGLDVKDYSLMAVLGCWRETVEALDRSARELQYHRDAEKDVSSAIWAALEATMSSFRGQVLVMSVKNSEWLASKVKLCQPPEKAAKVFKEAHLFVKSVIVRIAGDAPAGARWKISEQDLLSLEKHRPHLLLENMRLLVVAFDNMREEDRQQIATVKEIVNNRDWLLRIATICILAERRNMQRKNKRGALARQGSISYGRSISRRSSMDSQPNASPPTSPGSNLGSVGELWRSGRMKSTGSSTARRSRSEGLATKLGVQRTASMNPEVAPTVRGSMRRGLCRSGGPGDAGGYAGGDPSHGSVAIVIGDDHSTPQSRGGGDVDHGFVMLHPFSGGSGNRADGAGTGGARERAPSTAARVHLAVVTRALRRGWGS